MKNVVITTALRTPVGKFKGSLAAIPAPELGATVIKQLLADSGIDATLVDEVTMGQVLTAASGQNPARQTAIRAGLPHSVSALTINKVCGSGLKAVQLAAQAIRCNEADIIIAGGQENMSAAPHVLPGSRNGKPMGDWSLADTMITDGLWDAFNDYHMGTTAENIADQYGVDRAAQDGFAAESQQKAEAALASDRFRSELVNVEIPQRKGPAIVFDQDEFPRAGVTAESIARLPSAFKKDGTVTAANASGLNDGAAAVLVMSEEKAVELGLPVLARIAAAATAGVDPAIMGIGPAPATRRCLERADWSIEDLDLVEANEAFAAQCLSVQKELGWNLENINVNGGAIAIGHPIGASGARILVTLLHEMQRRDVKRGLATLCIGGGQGIAMAVER